MTVVGALDDFMVYNKHYIPLEYKTRGYAKWEKGSYHYYTQLDIYGFLLEKNGYDISGKGYLIYYYPENVVETGVIKFGIDVEEVNISAERALRVIQEAIEVIQSVSPPQQASKCVLCRWQQEDILEDTIIHI